MLKRIYLLFTAFILISATLFGQALQKGYDAFIANDHKKAIEHFNEAKSNEAEKEEALLMMALLNDYNQKTEQAFANVNELLKSTDNAEPYMSVLWTDILFGSYGKLNSAQIALLNTILKDPKRSGFVKNKANYSLARHFKASVDHKKAKTYYDKLNTVGTFSVVGPFENISASGFSKDFGALKKPNQSDVFKNKNHADVNWFEIKYDSGLWIDLSKHFIVANSIVYAQTFCNSPSDQEALLSIGTSGSCKIWINDHLIYSEEEERNNDMDTYLIPVKLMSGENRILIQIGISEISSSNFMLRFTDATGTSLQNLTYTPFSSGNYNKNYNFKSELKKNATIDFLEKKIKDNPKSLVNYILISKKLLSNDYANEARSYIDKSQSLATDCSYLLNMKMLVYLKDNNRTALSEAIEKMRVIDPNNVLSMSMDYDDAKTSENWARCNEIVEKIKSVVGENEMVLEKMIEMAAIEKRIEDLVNINKKAIKMYPDNYGFMQLQHTIEKELNKNTGAATKLLQNYTKKNYSISAMEMLAEAYFNLGTSGISKGMNLLETIAKNEPNRTASFTAIAGINFALKDYNTAIENYKKTLEIAPYVGKYNSNLALCYNEMGKKEEAREYYQKAITYYPNDYETRAKIRELDEDGDIWSLFDIPDLPALFNSSIDKSKYPEDNSAILWYEGQRVVYPNGGSETKYFIAVKAFNESGVDEWKEYYISTNSSQSLNVERAEIIKANGNKIKAEVNYNAVVYTGLEPGDGIILIYKVQNYYSGKLSEYFWDEHVLSSFYPLEKSRYELLVPEGTKFDYIVSNSDMKPEISKKEKFDFYKWEIENQAGIKSESYMPTLSEVGKVLSISSFPSWDYISKWYTDLAITKSKTSPEVKEKAAELLKGHENASDLEKARLIYNYIVKDIRYSSISFRQSGLIPQKASDVITTKIGDCKDVSTLFVALCKEMGLNAQLVLVNTRDNGINDMALPSIEFNHCIAKLNLGSEVYYVELTSDNFSFGTMGSSLIGSFTLDVTDNSSAAISPQYMYPKNRTLNTVTRATNISFDGNKMSLNKETYKVGNRAASMRETYRHMGKEEQFKEMNQAVSGEYQSLKFKEVNFADNLNSSSDTVTYTYAYDVNNVFTSIGNLQIMKIPLTDGFTPFEIFSTEKRNYDIELWKIIGSEIAIEKVTIQIPGNKTIAELPKSVTYKSDFAEYSLKFTKGPNNVLIIDREFKILKDVIPVADFEKAKKFFEDVVTADTQQIGFKSLP